MTIVASAPGKILWFGGYAVLERPNIGLVTTVDARVTAVIEVLGGERVKINSPQLKSSGDGTIDPLTGKLSLSVPDQLKLVLTAAEIASRYSAGKGLNVQGFCLTTMNAVAFGYEVSKDGVNIVQKSGLGASAAVTVATISGLLRLFGIINPDREVVHKLAQAAHSIATGKVGSGFDVAAATYGSILYTRYSPDILKSFPITYTNQQLVELAEKPWDYKIEMFEMPPIFYLTMANFIGHSMSTKSAVSEVNKLKASDSATYNRIMSGINNETMNAVTAIRKIASGNDSAALRELENAVDNGRKLTKELGIRSGVDIEADEETSLIEETKSNGAVISKLPGAGGKDSIVALSTSDVDRDRLAKFMATKPHVRLVEVQFDNRGFSVEG